LQAGCRISLSAREFMTPPHGTEFDDTGRLAFDAHFDDIGRAPTRNGEFVDLSIVPGTIGYTDL